MRKEQSRKKILIQMVFVSALSIFAALFFLFSVRGLLLTEANNRLRSINRKQAKAVNEEASYLTSYLDAGQDIIFLEDKNRYTEFDGQIYSYVLNKTGEVVVVFGDGAKQVSDQNDNEFRQFLPSVSLEDYRMKVGNEDGAVGKYRLLSGEYFYMAVRVTELLPGGYIISIVPAPIVDREIEFVWKIAVAIIVLAMICIMFGVIYSVYKRKISNRRMGQYGKLDHVTGLPHYKEHKQRAQQLINAERNTYAYVSFSIDKFNLISELSEKAYCDYLLKGVAEIVSNWVNEDETLARVHDDLFGMLLKYDDELKFKQRLIHMLKHAGDIPITENNFCTITFRSGVSVVKNETSIDKVIDRARKAREDKRTC